LNTNRLLWGFCERRGVVKSLGRPVSKVPCHVYARSGSPGSCEGDGPVADCHQRGSQGVCIDYLIFNRKIERDRHIRDVIISVNLNMRYVIVCSGKITHGCQTVTVRR